VTTGHSLVRRAKATKIGILASRNVMAGLKQFTTETHLRNGLPQQNQSLAFKYQPLKQSEVSAQNLAAALQRKNT
jgi:hypothetical protein